MDIRKRAEELEGEIIELRRWLHRHAELSWQEHESTEFIVKYLEDLGLPVHRYEGHTGCWTMIEGGKAGPDSRTILLRADFDALPLTEETGLPFASINEGVFHGCGHDTHAAMLLVACKMLLELRDSLGGNVKILFQAAEETAIGAKYYVEQGILEGVDAAYGCHISTGLPCGTFTVMEGPHTTATDAFTIRVQGLGCHGGKPHLGRDALVAACAIVSALQTIVSRMTDSMESLVITVGTLHSGSAYNVVADSAVMTGTVRTYSREVRQGVPEKIRQVAESVAAAYGCTAQVEYQCKTGPVVHDDPEMIRLARNAVTKLFGADALVKAGPMGGGDDFAYYSERVPGIYTDLGAAPDASQGEIYDLHHPKVRFNEDALKCGTAMHVQMAVDFLS